MVVFTQRDALFATFQRKQVIEPRQTRSLERQDACYRKHLTQVRDDFFHQVAELKGFGQVIVSSHLFAHK